MADVNAIIDTPQLGPMKAEYGVLALSYATVIAGSSYAPLPPGGYGYIAGEPPDGLVTFNGAPAVRTVDVFDRATNILVGSTTSAVDGTYRISGLNIGRTYDVRARGVDEHENDLIAARITPVPLLLTLSGSYPTGTVGHAYTNSLTISGGNGAYSNPRVISGSLPDGLALSISGRQLVLSGTPTAEAAYAFTVTVDSGDGQTASSGQNVNIQTNAVIRLPLTGSDGGTAFPDTSPNNFAVTGNGGITTMSTGVPGGGSATLFDGSNDWLVLPNNALLNNMGTADFAISVDVYPTDIANEHAILSCASSWTSAVAFLLEIRAGGDLRFYAGNNLPVAIVGGVGSLALNAWQTIRVERVSGVITLKVGASTIGTYTGAAVNIANGTQPKVGVLASDNSTPWQGYMRNLVITR